MQSSGHGSSSGGGNPPPTNLYDTRFTQVRGERRMVDTQSKQVIAKAALKKMHEDEKKRVDWERVLAKFTQNVQPTTTVPGYVINPPIAVLSADEAAANARKLASEHRQLARASFLNPQQKQRKHLVDRIVGSLLARGVDVTAGGHSHGDAGVKRPREGAGGDGDGADDGSVEGLEMVALDDDAYGDLFGNAAFERQQQRAQEADAHITGAAARYLHADSNGSSVVGSASSSHTREGPLNPLLVLAGRTGTASSGPQMVPRAVASKAREVARQREAATAAATTVAVAPAPPVPAPAPSNHQQLQPTTLPPSEGDEQVSDGELDAFLKSAFDDPDEQQEEEED